MAVLSKRNASGLAGLGAGAGSTLIMRDQFDRAGDDRITRPSVIWGLGSGAAALAGGMFVEPRTVGMPTYLDPGLMSYGAAAVATGLFSAFAPKGSANVGLPSVQRR